MKEFIYTTEPEAMRIYISSTASPEDTANAETAGGCVGPAEPEDLEWMLPIIAENMDSFVELTDAEADDRISHLAEEWNLSSAELQYLK